MPALYPLQGALQSREAATSCAWNVGSDLRHFTASGDAPADPRLRRFGRPALPRATARKTSVQRKSLRPTGEESDREPRPDFTSKDEAPSVPYQTLVAKNRVSKVHSVPIWRHGKFQ